MVAQRSAVQSSEAAAPLDDALIDQILAEEENHYVECKRASEKLQRGLEAACALANADGGLIAFGIDDPGKARGRSRVLGIGDQIMLADEFTRLLHGRLSPPLTGLFEMAQVRCTLHDGSIGTVVLCWVQRSPHVHSIVDDGTFLRLDRSNKQLTAAEITELMYARGSISAETGLEPNVDVALLDTEWWKEYAGAREITRQFPEALLHLGLARRSGDDIVPTRAAVLLLARDPAALLGAKTAIRVTRYKGSAADRKPTPNIARPPKTITGPLIRQVPDALSYICDSLADGVRMGPLGFEVVQRYPVRVIREALTNAVVHRDYHVQRDIQVRLFDDRIEIESPGALPGPVTALNIVRTQFARNPVLVNHLREFPTPPNLDIGEGVQMMFSTMDVAGLYTPLYLTRPAIDRDAVVVVLFNAERPTVWDQVCAHIERAGSVTNTDLRAILRTDNTLRASKMLREWVRKGLLVPVEPGSAKRLRRYTRPERGGQPPFSVGGGKQTAPDA